MKIIPAALVIAAVSATPLAAQDPVEQGVTVEAEGLGAIIAGDRARAEDEAVNDALRNAIERVMGTLVSSESLVENFVLVQDRILTRTRGYISSYDVLDRAWEEDLVRIRVRATVKASDLSSDLEAIGIVLASKNYPRLLVLVDETIFLDAGNTERAPVPVNASATTVRFIELLQPRGFRFVDASLVAARTESSLLESAMGGNRDEAVRIGRAWQADVVVLGKTIVQRSAIQQQLGGMVSMQASVTLQAIRADTGELIASTLEVQPHIGAGALDAAQRAIVRSVDRVTPRLEQLVLEKWSEEITAGSIVEVVITNAVTFADVQRFRQLLPSHVRGAQEVNLRNFATEMTFLEVRMRGTAFDLAAELSAKAWDAFTVEVTGVTANQVRIRLLPKDVIEPGSRGPTPTGF